MENENNLENKQTGLFGNMSNKQVEDFSKIGELIFGIVDKTKASDEKFQNNLNEEVKKINSRDLQIYTNGLKMGLHEGEKSGIGKGIVIGTAATVTTAAIMGLGYLLHNTTKKS